MNSIMNVSNFAKNAWRGCLVLVSDFLSRLKNWRGVNTPSLTQQQQSWRDVVQRHVNIRPAHTLRDGGDLDHRIRSSLSLAAGMRETPHRLLPTSVFPISGSLGRKRPTDEVTRFAESGATSAHSTSSNFRKKNKG